MSGKVSRLRRRPKFCSPYVNAGVALNAPQKNIKQNSTRESIKGNETVIRQRQQLLLAPPPAGGVMDSICFQPIRLAPSSFSQTRRSTTCRQNWQDINETSGDCLPFRPILRRETWSSYGRQDLMPAFTASHWQTALRSKRPQCQHTPDGLECVGSAVNLSNCTTSTSFLSRF
jgi:hypothetical protein